MQVVKDQREFSPRGVSMVREADVPECTAAAFPCLAFFFDLPLIKRA